MFFSPYVLTKKGPLAKIWLAAFYVKKLSKGQIIETDLADTVGSLRNPVVPIALRTSGHLLLGVVRIYEKKIKYLKEDCDEAILKFKKQAVPEKVTLPADAARATFAQITLPAIDPTEIQAFSMISMLPEAPAVYTKTPLKAFERARPMARMEEAMPEFNQDMLLLPPIGDEWATLSSQMEPMAEFAPEFATQVEFPPEMPMPTPEVVRRAEEETSAARRVPRASILEAQLEAPITPLEMGMGMEEQPEWGGWEMEMPEMPEKAPTPRVSAIPTPGTAISLPGAPEYAIGMEEVPELQLEFPAEVPVEEAAAVEAPAAAPEEEEEEAAPAPAPAKVTRKRKVVLLEDEHPKLDDDEIRNQLRHRESTLRATVHAAPTQATLEARQRLRIPIEDLLAAPGQDVESSDAMRSMLREIAAALRSQQAEEEAERRAPKRRVVEKPAVEEEAAPEEIEAAREAAPAIGAPVTPAAVPVEEEQPEWGGWDAEAPYEPEKPAEEAIPALDRSALDLVAESEPGRISGVGAYEEEGLPSPRISGVGLEERAEEEAEEEETVKKRRRLAARAPREPSISPAAVSPAVEGLSERTLKFVDLLEKTFPTAADEKLSYLGMAEGRSRRTAANCFYELLVLKAKDIVELEQDKPYGDIIISKTTKFDRVAAAISV